MKIKVKKYFITYLSAVLVLSNFSFATTLVLCSMGGDSPCACSNNTHHENSGLVLKNAANSCCQTKTVELSNSNILEILHNTVVNPLIHAGLLNPEVNGFSKVHANTSKVFNEFSYHPPNSEIPILNSSLLI